MASQSIQSLVEGGKATAAPPLGPALGPLGVNIGQVVSEINKKTEAFKGMQVPVTVTVADDKSFTITVGTPPASALIKKEAGLDKGSGNPLADKVADLKIEQIIKIAKMKNDALLGKNMTSKVKEVIGTCNSMGVMVEGLGAQDALRSIEKGEWADKIKSGRTELSAEELKHLEEERVKLAADIDAKRKQYENIAKQVSEKHKGATRSQLKGRLIDAGIPSAYVDQFLPEEEKKK